MDIKRLATDNDALQNGKWIKIAIGEGEDDFFEVKICSVLSRRYRAAQQEIAKQWRHIKEPNDAQLEAMSIDQIVEGQLIDWRGLSENGADVPYSQETAKRVLADYPLIMGMIAVEMQRMDHFKKLDQADDAKKSEPGSVGA